MGADVGFTAAGEQPLGSSRARRVSPAEGYERWAATYDEVPNPLLALEERYLLPLLTEVRKKSVLDLACGTGRWLEKVMELGCKSAVGVDCSGAMLRIAASKQSLRGRLARAAGENLPLPEAAFDLGICSFALGHLCDFKAMVREFARVTRVGADIFVSDLHPQAHARGWRVGFRDGGTAVEIRTNSRSSEEIVGEFCANGLACLKCETLWLGEPEAPLFELAGKAGSFADACRVPAVLVCHFRRIETTGGGTAGRLTSQPGRRAP